jgi:hypothetical protein
MADKFWRRAAENFRRLQPPPPRPGEVQHYSDNGLCAYWYQDGAGDGSPWSLGNATQHIKTLFKFAVQRAAVELGHPGGDSAVYFWLDLLKQEGLYYKRAPGGGEIYRVCNASAEYCLKCEADAIVARRKSKGGNARTPRAKSARVERRTEQKRRERAEQRGSGTPTQRTRKKTKREPHPDPEAILSGKTRVLHKTAATLLGVTVRRVRQLVVEGHLVAVGRGNARQIDVESIRYRLGLKRKTEDSGNARK